MHPGIVNGSVNLQVICDYICRTSISLLKLSRSLWRAYSYSDKWVTNDCELPSPFPYCQARHQGRLPEWLFDDQPVWLKASSGIMQMV